MIAALYSGGKDSTLAVHKMWDAGVKTDILISMVSENEFSYMFHRPNIKWTAMQAEAMGLKHVFHNSKGEKEKELVDIENALKQNEVTELITGAVASRYQADRINDICRKLNIKHHAPLWGIEPLTELNELAEKFDVIVTQVSAEGFDNNILGKRIDVHMIQRLVELHRKYRINMLIEGGEAESFVRDAPLFKKRIEIKKTRTEWSGPVGKYIIEEAELHNK